jgi:hypothetical protein
MSSQAWVQNEINLHKLKNRMVSANWNQNGAIYNHKTHHNRNFARITTFLLIIDFVISNEEWIKVTKFSILTSYEFHNFAGL